MPVNVKLRPVIACVLAIFLQWTALPRGHHATAVQDDISQTVRLKGVVSRLDWANPHAHLHLDVKGVRGTEEHRDVELGSPGAVIVSGLSKNALMPGVTVTVVGYPGKANRSPGSETALCATHVTLADGTTAEFVVGI